MKCDVGNGVGPYSETHQRIIVFPAKDKNWIHSIHGQEVTFSQSWTNCSSYYQHKKLCPSSFGPGYSGLKPENRIRLLTFGLWFIVIGLCPKALLTAIDYKNIAKLTELLNKKQQFFEVFLKILGQNCPKTVHPNDLDLCQSYLFW